MFRVCHAILSGSCSLVVTCWEKVELLALLNVIVSCVFVMEWYLIILISDHCRLPYYDDHCQVSGNFVKAETWQ